MCTRKDILDKYPRSTWQKLIDEWIYNELDRYILKRHLLDQTTFDKIAEEINKKEYCLEILQIKRRFYKASDRLFSCAENAQI